MTRTDQRRALRLPVAVEQEEAQLRWQDRDYPVRVTDQSAGGFAIQVECPIDIEANQIAALVWHEGSSAVRVVSQVDEGSFIRIGLERVEGYDLAEDFDPGTSGWSLGDAGRRLFGSNLTHVVLGILVILGFALAAIAWESLHRSGTAALHAPSISKEQQADKAAAAAEARRRAAKSLEQFSAFWRGNPVIRALDASSLPRPAQNWIAGQVQAVEGVVLGILRTVLGAPVDVRKTSVAVQKVATDTADSIGRTVARGNEAILGALPQFMNLLELSSRQRRELDQIVTSAHQATQEIHQRMRELGTQQAMREIQRIRQATGDSVVALLSPAQVEKLRSLIAGQHGGGSKAATSQGAATAK
jgi:hypothetical protein